MVLCVAEKQEIFRSFFADNGRIVCFYGNICAIGGEQDFVPSFTRIYRKLKQRRQDFKSDTGI
jgi:hypothetical protein